MNFIHLFHLLTAVFVILKLTGTVPFAAWSWWLVLAPSLAVVAVAVVLVGLGVIALILWGRGGYH